MSTGQIHLFSSLAAQTLGSSRPACSSFSGASRAPTVRWGVFVEIRDSSAPTRERALGLPDHTNKLKLQTYPKKVSQKKRKKKPQNISLFSFSQINIRRPPESPIIEFAHRLPDRESRSPRCVLGPLRNPAPFFRLRQPACRPRAYGAANLLFAHLGNTPPS